MRRHREPLATAFVDNARRTTVRAESEGDDASYTEFRGLADGLPHAIALRDALHEREVGSFSSGISWMQRSVASNLVRTSRSRLPAFAAGSDGRDSARPPDAAHREVVQFFIGEGKGDDIAFRAVRLP